MTVLVDVIIPSKTTYNLASMIKKSIGSLKESESEYSFNVILVESMPFITNIGQDMTIMFDQEKFSYNRALNLGYAASSSDWVVFANNDLNYIRYWFTALMASAKCFPQFESFTPWNSHNHWHEKAFPNNWVGLLPGYRICYEIGGWCLVAKRSALQKIMPLSERCSLWYSDNIYADALQEHEIKHALCANSRVDHLTSQTIDYNEYITHSDQIEYLKGKIK